MAELRTMYQLDLRISKVFLGILAVMLVACLGSILAGHPMFALTFMPMVSLLFVNNHLGTIEAGKLEQLFGSLPVSRRTVMRAHYLAAFTVICLCSLPWLVAGAIHLANPEWGIGGQQLAVGLGVAVAMLPMASVTIAAIIQWGTKVGAWAAFVLVFICVGLMVALGGVGVNPPQPGPATFAALAALVIGLSWLSYRWAVRTYAAQDH